MIERIAIVGVALLVLACALFAIVASFAGGVGAQERAALYVVAARDTVLPGDLVSVTVTGFGDVGEVEFDSGGLEVVTDTVEIGGTRYVTLRVEGPPRDVRVRAWGGGMEASAVIRVCCVASAPAVDPSKRVYLPSFRH